MASIHATAIVDPQAELAEDVEVGPYCVVEGDVKIGAGTVLRPHVIVRRYTTLGEGNFVDSFTVLGGEPQDLKFDPATVSSVRIGDFNRFREGVTIQRATGDGGETRVGNRTFWMATSHAGHNSEVHDEAVLVNGAMLGGHATLGRAAILSGNVGVHQFTWIGERVMSRGNAGASMHVPPYVLISDINRVVGLNAVGLRRAPDLSREDCRQIREAFNITYRSGLTPANALKRMDACGNWGEGAGKFREFVRRVIAAQPPYNRGLCPMRKHL